jgi:hypothetical protein
MGFTVPKPTPLSVTDEQMNMILAPAAPLQLVDRGPFLEALALTLRSEPTVGDGVVSRCCRQLQHEFMRGRWPSDTETGPGAPNVLRKLRTAKV